MIPSDARARFRDGRWRSRTAPGHMLVTDARDDAYRIELATSTAQRT